MVKPSRSSSRKYDDLINKNKFSVYDFDQDDHRAEKDSQKILSKFKSKRPNSNKFSFSPVDKYSFLRSFSQGTKTTEDEFENEAVGINKDFDVMDERIYKWNAAVSSFSKSEPLAYSPKCSLPGDKYHTPNGSKPGVWVNDNKLFKCSPPQILADNQPLFVDSEDEQCSNQLLQNQPLCVDSEDEQDIKQLSRNEPICIDSDNDIRNECSSSISSSDPAGDEGSLEEQPLSHVSSGLDSEAAVIVKPDCIIFGNMYSTTSQLTFSSRFINLEGSTVCVTKRSFSFNWSIADVVKIESVWCSQVETAMVYLQLKSEDEKAAELDSRFSGIVMLNFAVNDPQWSKKQQAIESLHMIYKATWTMIVDIDPIPSEFSCLGQNSMSCSKDCSPNERNSTEVFEDVIFPPGDSDAVSIGKKEIELLQPATFLNDTIIDFYVKYLEQNIKQEDKHRFHFFNSFFFRKLADLDKERTAACEGRAAFQRVRKWTRKVNLFEKDYLFIPVNFSLHWSLIVICHPGEVAYSRDDVVKSSKVPCILHMDSIKGIHRGLKNLFQIYLLEEWRERHNELSEDVVASFLSLPYIAPELPQQENSFDCGLFLLYYVERFLQQAPVNFSPFDEASYFLNKEWFQPAEASSRRDYIKNLIYKISNDNAHKDAPAANERKYFSHSVDEGDIGNELLREKCDGREACSGGYSSPNANEEICEISQVATPVGNLRVLGEPNVIPGDTSSGHTTWSVAKRTFQYHGKSKSLNHSCTNMSPIEEEEAIQDRTECSSVQKAGGRQIVYGVSRDSLDYKEVEILAVESLSSLEVQDEEGFDPKVQCVSVSEERDTENDISLMSREEPDCCVVEDSVEGNGKLVINENENPHLCEARSITFHDLEVESPSNSDVKAQHDKQVAASRDQDIDGLNFWTSRHRSFRRVLSKDLHS